MNAFPWRVQTTRKGFWWLAKAEGPAVQYTGRKKTENGVTFVDGGYSNYISLRYYERFPPSSPDSFKLSAKVWTENSNAEGLISRQVAVSDASVRRSARGNASSLASPSVLATGGPRPPGRGGRGPLGFTPRFDAGAPARGPRKDFARGPFAGLYPTCQGRVHVPVSYPGCFTHLKKIILYKA